MGTDESTPVPSAGVGWMTLGICAGDLRTRPLRILRVGGDIGCAYGFILLYDDQTVLKTHRDAGGGSA